MTGIIMIRGLLLHMNSDSVNFGKNAHFMYTEDAENEYYDEIDNWLEWQLKLHLCKII